MDSVGWRKVSHGIYATQYEPKQEPFAFKIDELDEALKGINAFSFYSSDVEPFDKKGLMELVAQLIN